MSPIDNTRDTRRLLPAFAPRILPARVLCSARVRETDAALKIILTQFPLEVVLRGVEAPPCVLVDQPGEGASVLFSNAPAAGLGVRTGMPLKAALAFSPDLIGVTRNVAAEARMRTQLVQWLQWPGHDVQSGTLPDGSLDVRLVGFDGPPGALRIAQLRRDFRALGFRATLTPTIALAQPGLEPHLGRLDPEHGAQFFSSLDLPWNLGRPREAYLAAGRLLEELRVISEARRAPARWVQWTLQHASGPREHLLFELDATFGIIPKLNLLIRERLHRMSLASPLCGVALKAGF